MDYIWQDREITSLPNFVKEEIFPLFKRNLNLENLDKCIILPSAGDIRAKVKPVKPATPSSQKKLEKNLVKKKQGGKRDKGVRTSRKKEKPVKDAVSEEVEGNLQRLLIRWFVRDMEQHWEVDLAQKASGIFICSSLLGQNKRFEQGVWNWVGRSLSTSQG